MIAIGKNNVKAINEFFRTAIKTEHDKVETELALTDLQTEIYHMFYRKGIKDKNAIASSLKVSRRKVERELCAIRKMLDKVWGITGVSPRKKFNCKTATEDEIRKRCIELGKKDDYAYFMILVYRSGKTRKEIAEKFFLSEATVKKYKHDRTLELEGV